MSCDNMHSLSFNNIIIILNYNLFLGSNLYVLIEIFNLKIIKHF
jgi:hypothetical protein